MNKKSEADESQSNREQLQRLQRALEQGEASGEPAAFDMEEFIKEKKQRAN